ncbi:ATP-binding protein [Frankia sp. AgB1.9]|uniref:ATP-binding protein n=1 Tax=unclassified Frankia TaxID=2632575 RepID=UPI0019346698|nr:MULTISPECIES: ATP-binding protein [unclassified Frankia]MBL7493307.1 ATP-binding protein [Frankia sp. AgW1.1]MBL7551288.1 ATP-binding protein [Frankia sp. AgB1.9]MBL7621523.1 ATP-binding protein [Frankia sp. AgB1.8]
MTRRFNTSGPCLPDLHYMIPALTRLPAAPALVDESEYFVVHAPRQTGKTTALRALATELTASGRYAALHFSCELAESTGDDYAAAQRAILSEIEERSDTALPLELKPPRWPDGPDESMLRRGLTAWAKACPRPLVLFFDEIDAIQGQSLINVLRQLRAGFTERPNAFPASVILCGLRDVRDYKAASGGDPSRLGTASPFNVKVESLRLGDFTEDEVHSLYGQHTADTGQEFTPDALSRAFELTAGQPWLVNALAREVVRNMAVPVDVPITTAHLDRAKERLILARATHLDSLVDKLTEPRVRRVIEPMLAGELTKVDPYDDDLSYVRDLGLIKQTDPVQVANPIYREVIPRVLAAGVQANVTASPSSFVRADGRLDFRAILESFAGFWRENGDMLAAAQLYREAAPHLILMAFLQRVVNGGGYVDREYGVGRGRVDLLVRWPYTDADRNAALQREALEIKVHRPDKGDPTRDGIGQLDAYLDALGLDTGTLVIFDRRPTAAPIAQRTQFGIVTTPRGRPVTLLRA